MAQAGYEQYEISNWCRPGQECRHNLVYWRNGDWLGLGAGAHSHCGGYRFADVYSPKQYIRRLAQSADHVDPASGPPREILRQMRQVTFVDEQTTALQMADSAIL